MKYRASKYMIFFFVVLASCSTSNDVSDSYDIEDIQLRSASYQFPHVSKRGLGVVLEVSEIDLIKSFARTLSASRFVNLIEVTKLEFKAQKCADFFNCLLVVNERQNPDFPLVRHFEISDIEELGVKSTDRDVVSFLKKEMDAALDELATLISIKSEHLGVVEPLVRIDRRAKKLYVLLSGVTNREIVKKEFERIVNLSLYETYTMSEIGNDWNSAEIFHPDLQRMVTPYALGFSFCKSNNISKVNEILNNEEVKSLFSRDICFLWSKEEIKSEDNDFGKFIYAIKIPLDGKPVIDCGDIEYAAAGLNEEEFTINIKMTPKGSDKLAQMTSDNVGRPIAIVLDESVLVFPTVNSAITGGSLEIAGGFTMKEASELTSLLNLSYQRAGCRVVSMELLGDE